MKNWLDIPKDKDNHDDDWAICELEKPLGEMVGDIWELHIILIQGLLKIWKFQ